MVRVSWTQSAIRDVDEVRAYIAQFDEKAADDVAARLIRAGNSLIDFPERGRIAAMGSRALSNVRPYVLFYDVDGDDVTILHVRHGAQLG